MKQIITLVTLIIFCFSCSKSDDQPFSEKVLGDWAIHSFVINSCPDASDNIPFSVADENGCINISGGDLCMSINFNSDGTGFFKQNIDGFDDIQPIKYVLDENKELIMVDSEFENMVFSLKDDGIAFEMDEEGCICEFGFTK